MKTPIYTILQVWVSHKAFNELIIQNWTRRHGFGLVCRVSMLWALFATVFKGSSGFGNYNLVFKGVMSE